MLFNGLFSIATFAFLWRSDGRIYTFASCVGLFLCGILTVSTAFVENRDDNKLAAIMGIPFRKRGHPTHARQRFGACLPDFLDDILVRVSQLLVPMQHLISGAYVSCDLVVFWILLCLV